MATRLNNSSRARTLASSAGLKQQKSHDFRDQSFRQGCGTTQAIWCECVVLGKTGELATLRCNDSALSTGCYRALIVCLVFIHASSLVCALLAADDAIEIGSRRELFVDNLLIDGLRGNAELKLHQPVPREVVFTADQPWEGNLLFHVSVFRDGNLYRMYYRGWHYDEERQTTSQHKVICYAESRDAIHWVRPELGIVDFQGSKENNIILDCKQGVASNGAFAVFRDDNPKCDPAARYKALALHSKSGQGLYAFGSTDGVRWTLLDDRPRITRGKFDSHNLAFWDGQAGVYRAYWRWYDKRVRAIRTATSPDFIHWSKGVNLQHGDAPREHLYTNAVQRYPRAPQFLIGFPKRLVPSRKSPTGFPLPGVSDGVFMSSRDGVHFHRWPEAFIRPGPQPDRWVNRNNFTAWGLMETPSSLAGAPAELSLYSTEAYFRGSATRLRRYTLRQDGFVSLYAPLSGGELITKPITFDGTQLKINFSTSAAGSVRIELQDADGKPIEGYALADCRDIFGDEIERVVTWNQGSDLRLPARKPIRLRLVVKDADVYSFRFSK